MEAESNYTISCFLIYKELPPKLKYYEATLWNKLL